VVAKYIAQQKLFDGEGENNAVKAKANAAIGCRHFKTDTIDLWTAGSG
jgi:hypothetical protein